MRTPQQFYKELGVKGLSARKKQEQTKLEIKFLKNILNKEFQSQQAGRYSLRFQLGRRTNGSKLVGIKLNWNNKKQRILDVGCGYGRFTIPLAKAGYDLSGIDISANFVEEAEKNAKKEKLKISFRLGDMRKLPYENRSFDAIICMWSVFIELRNQKDQLKALKEMLRVLDNSGFAFIEMPVPKEIKDIKDDKNTIDKHKILKGRVIQSIISGVLANPMYLHNKKTMERLMQKIKPRKYKISVENFGGRPRMLIWMWK